MLRARPCSPFILSCFVLKELMKGVLLPLGKHSEMPPLKNVSVPALVFCILPLLWFVSFYYREVFAWQVGLYSFKKKSCCAPKMAAEAALLAFPTCFLSLAAGLMRSRCQSLALTVLCCASCSRPGFCCSPCLP